MARYGYFDLMRVNNGELNASEATNFFNKFHIKLKLPMTYNPEDDGKSGRVHQPIVNAIVKACKDKTSLWPDFLSLALMESRMTCSSVTSYAPAELINDHLILMPIEHDIASGRTIA